MARMALVRVALCLFLLPFIASCRKDANFHVVSDGKFYRSAQLTKDELDLAMRSGIRTVINLRGEMDAQWYYDERDTVARYGGTLINIPWNTFEFPNREDLIALLDAYKYAERPILVHCRRGVDRTGEASAIYQMVVENKNRDEALDMLSERFGYSATLVPAKIHFIRHIWQGEQWARNLYNPCSGVYDPFYYKPEEHECARQLSTGY